MDRAAFIAGSGAREQMRRQATQSNNLANLSSTGFRAEIAAQRTAPVVGGPGYRTRAYAMETTTGADMTPGPMVATGRNLDVAIQGEGWLAVQSDGVEAYTRNGDLQISPAGLLVDSNGRPVVGEGGLIEIPDGAQVLIGGDGSVSAILDDDRAAPQVVGQLKLVNPPANEMERRNDGLFALKQGGVAPMDPTVKIGSGMVEMSNVNAVETMVNIIASARQFETQIKMIQEVEQNQKSATQILSLN